MKWGLRAPRLKWRHDADRGLPGYLLGGRIRTTTVVLVVAFFAVLWAYDANRPEPEPVPQVIPPGFVPDPNYTWVPRSQLNKPPATVTETLTPPPVTETITPHHSEPVPPPFGLPPPPPPPGAPIPAPRGKPPGPPTTPLP